LMVKSGLPINEAINILGSDAKGRLKFILKKVLIMVESGSHLADSLGKFPHVFNNFFTSMVSVGEASGTLEQSLANLADHLKKSNELRSKIRAALLYPTIVMTAIVGLGFTLAVFVLPKLTGFFSSLGTELPLSTRILLNISNYFQHYWAITLVAVIAVVLFFIVGKFFKPTRLVLHWLYQKIPVAKNFSTKANLASFCRSMALLLDSGMTLDVSLDIAKGNVSNIFYALDIEKILTAIKKGEALGVTMSKYEKHFPVIVSRMITVGEKSGTLGETFAYLAIFYEDEVDNMSKNLSSVIEPILLVIIGGAVAFIAMSIITPIYDLTSSVGS